MSFAWSDVCVQTDQTEASMNSPFNNLVQQYLPDMANKPSFGGVSNGIMITGVKSMNFYIFLEKNCFRMRISTMSTVEIPTGITKISEKGSLRKN